MKSSANSAREGQHAAIPREANEPATSPPIDITRASALFEEIATLALRADRHCHFEHEFFDDPDSDGLIVAERVSLELAYLRDVIRRLGWTADLGCALVCGTQTSLGPVRGDAQAWMLSPSFNGAREECSHG